MASGAPFVAAIRPWVMRPASLVCALLVTAACTGTTGGSRSVEPPLPSSAAVSNHDPTLPPIHFSAAKLWSRGRDGPRRGPDSVVIRGDSIVVQDSKSRANSNEIGVVDAATGRLRWSVDQLHALPGMPEATRWWHTDADPSAVGQGADWSVLVGYVRSSRSPYSRADEFGVAALSGTDGHVRWMTPIVPSVASPASHIAELVAANDTVALLDVNNERGDAAPMLAAVDATGGKQLWKRTGAEAAALAWNTVLAWQRARPSLGSAHAPPSVLIALDATTGKLLWRTPGPPEPALSLPDDAPDGATPAVAAAGGVALIPTSGIHERVVDLRTGHELAGVDTITPCVIDDHPDGDGLVACLSGDLDPGSGYRVETFRPGDHEFRVSKRLVHLSVPSLPILDTVWKGYVFIDTGQPTDIDTGQPTGLAADDAGNIVGTDVPGRVQAISDQYAVFGSTKHASDGYVVRRVTR